MRIEDIRFGERTLHVRGGKGGKDGVGLRRERRQADFTGEEEFPHHGDVRAGGVPILAVFEILLRWRSRGPTTCRISTAILTGAYTPASHTASTKKT